jgi:hypothetical protein
MWLRFPTSVRNCKLADWSKIGMAWAAFTWAMSFRSVRWALAAAANKKVPLLSLPARR